jgi:hypothetical protein
LLRIVGLSGLLLCIAGPVRAGVVTFTTNAQATISSYSNTNTNSAPGFFYFDPNFPDFLQAFNSAPDDFPHADHRAVVEFDISTLAGVELTSATLRFSDPLGDWVSADDVLSGWFGDGTVTLADWYNIGNPTANFSQGSTDLDVEAFIQNAIDSGENYIGFTLWQDTFIGEGFGFQDGAQLILASNSNFNAPPPLPSPFSGTGGAGSVPEPSMLVIFSFAGACALICRLRGGLSIRDVLICSGQIQES